MSTFQEQFDNIMDKWIFSRKELTPEEIEILRKGCKGDDG